MSEPSVKRDSSRAGLLAGAAPHPPDTLLAMSGTRRRSTSRKGGQWLGVPRWRPVFEPDLEATV